MRTEKCIAIVLAAGQGKRMNAETKKQYLLIDNKPVLYYSLHIFQESSIIDEIILVTTQEDILYCQEEIVKKYSLTKVTNIIAGGKERYHSVYEGLKSIETCHYVFIHDGARPFIREDILERAFETVKHTNACVIAVKAKDTVKIADENGIIQTTPSRDLVWNIQTPQVFSYEMIKNAYTELMLSERNGAVQSITDDAMVFEKYTKQPIQLLWGTYENIKITTPEDLKIAEVFISDFFAPEQVEE